MIVRPLEIEDINKADVPTLNLKKLGIGKEHYGAIEKAVRELSLQGIEIRIEK